MQPAENENVKKALITDCCCGGCSLYALTEKGDLYYGSFSDEEENIKGYIEFESSDILTRQMMLAEIRLVLLTNGHLPILREAYYVVHILFIAFIQNIFLAAFLILAEARKR